MEDIRNYKPSQYRFTSPIRFFKANDPIYFEVDNIPLKQLQENDMWLKDQIFSIAKNSWEFDRSSFTELRPDALGEDNTVKVSPGRFTARINDAHNLTKLQIIDRILPPGTGGPGDVIPNTGNQQDPNAFNKVWLAGSLDHPRIQLIIEKFKEAIQLDLNGLVERAFTWPARSPGRKSVHLSNTAPEIDLVGGNDSQWNQPPYPVVGAVLWNKFDTYSNGTTGYLPGVGGGQSPITVGGITPGFVRYSYTIKQRATSVDNAPEFGFAKLPMAENNFIKRWRGVARTAVVDVPNELSIEIPPFNPEDYFYIDENNNKVLLDGASQRIDLLFIYSKPVDASSTTIPKFVNNSPQVITEPQLGLVYGAGLGVNFKNYGPIKINEVYSPAGASKGQFELEELVDSTLADGTPKMLSHFADASGSNTGFNISGVSIKGSFPAPDDLMNLAPLLDLTLSPNSLPLIGQSILPIAYIVVKKDAASNEFNQKIITKNDVIDIRPFFRTTELAYNERAGIAAAIPAPSLANPVVTQAELGYELQRVVDSIPTQVQTSPTFPRVVHTNTIQGGWAFGVEGALLAYEKQRYPTLTTDQLVRRVIDNYNYNRVDRLPDWDVAEWASMGTGTGGSESAGLFPNDRICYHAFKMNGNSSYYVSGLPVYKYAAYEDADLTKQIKRFGTTRIRNLTASLNSNAPSSYRINFNSDNQAEIDGFVNILFVKKRVNLDISRVPWMGDYNVNVRFKNCSPLTCQTSGRARSSSGGILGGAASNSEGTQETLAGTAGLWVEKYPDHFYIYASWVANDYRSLNETVGITGSTQVFPLIPPLNREGNHFAGFAVFNKDWAFEHIHNLPAGPLLTGYSAGRGEATVGIAIYPTVEFEVIGIPSSFEGKNAMSFSTMNDYTRSPTIKLA